MHWGEKHKSTVPVCLCVRTFCDHLTMKDTENIIKTEESHIENPGACQVDIDSKGSYSTHFVVDTL
jgi:hypothetical protein